MAAVNIFCIGRLLHCAQILERRGHRDATYGEIAALTMGPLQGRT